MRLSPGALASLIEKFQASKEETAELGRQVAAALGIEAANGIMGASVRKRPGPKPGTLDPSRRIAAPGWRRDQILALMHKHEQVTPAQVAEMVGITRGNADTALANLVRTKLAVRVAPGLYALPGKTMDLPNALKAAVKADKRERTKAAKRAVAQAELPLPAPPKMKRGDITTRILEMAANGPVTVEMAKRAGLGYTRSDGKSDDGQHLRKLALRGKLEYHPEDKTYTLKKSPA